MKGRGLHNIYFKLVAGAGFEPTTFPVVMKSRARRAELLHNIYFKLVAGAGFEPTTFGL
jgi:hypothetical protein